MDCAYAHAGACLCSSVVAEDDVVTCAGCASESVVVLQRVAVYVCTSEGLYVLNGGVNKLFDTFEW